MVVAIRIGPDVAENETAAGICQLDLDAVGHDRYPFDQPFQLLTLLLPGEPCPLHLPCFGQSMAKVVFDQGLRSLQLTPAGWPRRSPSALKDGLTDVVPVPSAIRLPRMRWAHKIAAVIE